LSWTIQRPMYPVRVDEEAFVRVQLARWGDGLGVQIPDTVAEELGLSEGIQVEMAAQGDRIVISRLGARYDLADLLDGMTPEAMQDAFDWGPDVGRERIE